MPSIQSQNFHAIQTHFRTAWLITTPFGQSPKSQHFHFCQTPFFVPLQHSTSSSKQRHHPSSSSLLYYKPPLHSYSALLSSRNGGSERAALYKPREGNPRAAKQIFWFWPWVEGKKGEVVRESPPFSFQPPPAATIFTATPFQLQTKNQDQIVCASWERAKLHSFLVRELSS